MTNQLERQDGASSSHGHADVIEAMRSQVFNPKETGKVAVEMAIGGAALAAGKEVGEKAGMILNFGNAFDMSDPFKQSGFDDCKNTFDKVWHGMKKLFGGEDKLDDQIKNYVENKKLNPNEKKELEQEKKLYEEEMSKHRASYLQMNINGKIYPPPDVENDPRFKEMKHVNELVKQEESAIQKAVEAKMPGLMPDVKKEMDEYNESFKIRNPYGTGEGLKPHIAGKHLEIYWDEVRKETERRAHS